MEEQLILTMDDIKDILNGFYSGDICHCGEAAMIHDGGFTRGMCEHCDAVRCDAYPGECGR